MQYAYAAGRRRFPNYTGKKDGPLISPFTMSITKSLMRNNVVLPDTLIPASAMTFCVYILDFTLPIYVNPSSLTTLSDAYKSRDTVRKNQRCFFSHNKRYPTYKQRIPSYQHPIMRNRTQSFTFPFTYSQFLKK